MKVILLWLCICFGLNPILYGQTADKTSDVIEGGKLIVELVKVLGTKKETIRDDGCKGQHADLCVVNETPSSITVSLEQHTSHEKREVVILPAGKECFLRAGIGVWTYDLKYSGQLTSIRKGDVLIEGCNNLTMTIK